MKKEFQDLVQNMSADHFAELQGAVAARARAARSFSLDDIKVGMSPEDRQRARDAIKQAVEDLQNGR